MIHGEPGRVREEAQHVQLEGIEEKILEQPEGVDPPPGVASFTLQVT